MSISNEQNEDVFKRDVDLAADSFSYAADYLSEAKWNTSGRAELLCKAYAAITLGWRYVTRAGLNGFGPIPLDDEGKGGVH